MAFLPQRPVASRLLSGRTDRGVAFPSPVVMLSVLAVGMAGVAFVATNDDQPAEREPAGEVEEQEPALAASF